MNTTFKHDNQADFLTHMGYLTTAEFEKGNHIIQRTTDKVIGCKMCS